MEQQTQLEALQKLAGSIAAAQGVELVWLELKGQGAGRLLRVYVDQPSGVGLEECERFSRALGAELDAEDELLAGPFTLEVSSPGLDRPLLKPDDFERFAGQRAQVRAQVPVEGSRCWTGILEGQGEGGVRLRPEGAAAVLTIAWTNLAQARLAPSWAAPARPRRH